MSTKTSGSQSVRKAIGVQCISCGNESPHTRRYCGKCGQLLWDPCLDCGENNPVDERFCGKCGGDLANQVQLARRQLQHAISSADKQAAQGRFLEAASSLTDLAIVAHSQLNDLASQIRDRIVEFPEQRERAIEHSKGVIAQVEQLLAEHDYERAWEQLARVPLALRNQDISDLLKHVEAVQKETRLLRDRVKQALEKRQYDGLLQTVQRLAELSPADEQVGQLYSQLQQRLAHQQKQETARLLKLAKLALRNCDYRQARAAVQQLLVREGLSEEVAKTLSAVKERVWLAERLRTAPIVTHTLVKVAERLLKLQPHDAEHAELGRKLNARWATAQQGQGRQPVSWAKFPESSVFGIPVLPVPLPAEFAGGPKTEIPPRSMLVAFGLALQGLGRAAISLDLSPTNGKESWLNRLANRSSGKNVVRAWGIDIGAKYLKAVQLSAGAKGDCCRITRAIAIPLEEQEASDISSSMYVVKRFLSTHSLEGETIVVNIPGTQTLGRFFDLPAPKPEKFFEAVQFELKSRIPLDAGQLSFGYHWFELPANVPDTTPRRRVVLVAANRVDVERQLSLFQESNVARIIVQSDCVALINSLCHCPPLADSEEAVAMLEIGSATSNLVVVSNTRHWFRGLFQGTQGFDKAIANAFQKTLADAERIRRQPERCTAMHEVHERLLPAFQLLSQEIERTLVRFRSETGQDVSRIYLCGGGSEQFGLLHYLHSEE